MPKREDSTGAVVWRDKDGKISCPGDLCPKDCDDTCPIWLNTCGVELLMRSQPELAIDYLKKAVALAPDFPDAYNNLGSAYGMNNQHKEAFDAFAKALELKPTYPQALRGLIAAEKNLGMYTEALDLCDVYENITGTDMRSLRDEIRKQRDQNDPSNTSWVQLALLLLKDGRERGYIQSEGFPNIPEIMIQAEPTCAKIMESMQEECEKNPSYDLVRLTFSWAAFAGIGAVYHWDVDWPALSAKGIFETLTEEREFSEMDEYVLGCIGLPFGSDEAKELSSYLYHLAARCIFQLMALGSNGPEAVMQGAEAMFAFGMVLEMNRLGMK